MKRQLILLAIASMLPLSMAEASDSHYMNLVRHIYNDSDKPWYVKVHALSPSGTFKFLSSTCLLDEKCIIPAHSAVEIAYVQVDDTAISGQFTLTDYKLEDFSFRYVQKSHWFKESDVHIQHAQSDTNAVALNEPANGDIKIIKDQWRIK